MNKPTHIIIHCSDSSFGCAREIRKWHIQRGWSDIGYSYVILNGVPEPNKMIPALDGTIEVGRYESEEGAHCLGYNDRSIGICLIGTKQFTIKQFDALKALLTDICSRYSITSENILGHGETDSGKQEGKTCPNFDVGAFRMYLKGRI